MIGTTPLSAVVAQAAAAIPQSMIGAPSGVAPLSAGGVVPRGDLPVDMQNAQTLIGAGNVVSDATMQTLYNSLASGSVVAIPSGASWDGGVPTPSANKVETWLFQGAQAGAYPAPPGDGDLGISYNNGNATFAKRSMNQAPGLFVNPLNGLFWNADPNYTGPYSSNYQQLAGIGGKAISGPTSHGNTSPINLELDSYGNNPSSSYDVVINGYARKYGQNSVWGITDALQDFSGRIPQAFAAWNEYDLWDNGYDVPPWDPSFYAGTSGNRVGAYYSLSTINSPAWVASTQVYGLGEDAGSPNSPDQTCPNCGGNTVGVKVAGANYDWFVYTSGTTGTTQPSWPAPSEFVGSISGTTLTVSSAVSGTPALAVGMWVTFGGTITPIQITALGTGTGGAGTYTLSASPGTFGATGMYAAPHVTDGTAVWAFGATQITSVHSGVRFTGPAILDTAIGGDETIGSAVLDTSHMPLQSGAAAVRLAPNQPIDFSGGGTAATVDQRTLAYSNYGSGALVYQTPNGSGGRTNALTIDDAGDVAAASSLAAGTSVVISPNLGGANLSLAPYGNANTILGWNYTNGGAEADTINSFAGAGTLANWLQKQSSGSIAVEMSLSGTGELSTTAAAMNRSLATPASSSAPCSTGEREADANYVYVCVASNTWKRAALSSF